MKCCQIATQSDARRPQLICSKRLLDVQTDFVLSVSDKINIAKRLQGPIHRHKSNKENG